MRMNPAWTPTQRSLYAKLVNWCDYPVALAKQIVNDFHDTSGDKSGSSAGDTEKRGA